MKNYTYQEAVFNSKWLSKFINCWFFTGEKFKIEMLIYDSFLFLKKFLNTNGVLLLFEALEQLKPWVGLKLRVSLKQKKSQIQAHPVILTSNIQYKKSIYWLIKSIQLRKEITFCMRSNNEMRSIIFGGQATSLKRKFFYYNYAIIFKSVIKFRW